MHEKGKILLRKGFAFPCAFCVKLWRAIDRGHDVCEIAYNGANCGGPMLGMSFPKYEGILSRNNIANFCFRCGGAASKMVRPIDGGFVGVCDKHIVAFESIFKG